MNTTANIILIIALVLVLVGSVIFVSSLAAADWNFANLDNGKFETNTYDLTGELTDIAIDSDITDVNIIPTSDGSIRVSCYERKKVRHSVTLEDGRLVITDNDERKWYERIFSFGTPRVDVYIPEGAYTSLVFESDTGDVVVPKGTSFTNVGIKGSTGDVKFCAAASESLKIELSTGDIEIENAIAGDVTLTVTTGDIDVEGLICRSLDTDGDTGEISLDGITADGAVSIERDTGDVELQLISAKDVTVKTTTGDVEAENITCSGKFEVSVTTGECELSDVNCQSFVSSGDTGRLTMHRVVAEGTMSIKRDTGDVRFEKCDAAEVKIETDTGDVVGSFLSDKIIFAESDTGRIDVPKSTVGGKCEIDTDTGKIIIDIEK